MKAATRLPKLRIIIIIMLISMIMASTTMVYADIPESENGNGEVLLGYGNLDSEENESLHFEVSVFANNGTDDCDVMEVEEGLEYILPECTYAAPEGHVFRCWDNDPNGSETQYYPGDSIEVNDNIDLYAIWDSDENYKEDAYDEEAVTTAPKRSMMLAPLESADGVPEPDAEGNLTVNVVEDYGADNTGSYNSAYAINDALARALDEDVNHLTVVIPEGSYICDSILYIYSNTTILAAGATIKARDINGNFVRGSHRHYGSICWADSADGCSLTGYSQIRDIEIDGGTWDAGAADNSANETQVFQIRHGENITLKNLTVQNSTNHHINLSACNNVTISNVTCKNAIKFSGPSTATFYADAPKGESRFRVIEAIHLDFAIAAGEPYISPKDGTPCKNVTISNCTFNNVFAGVGTHRLNEYKYRKNGEKKATNIKITNCSFTNLKSGNEAKDYGNALYMKYASGVTFTNNTIVNAQALANLEEVSGINVSNNSIAGAHQNAVYLRNCGGTNNKIENNTISCSDSEKNAVWAISSAKTFDDDTASNQVMNATISGNKVSGSFKNGIGAEGAKTNLTVNSNTISGSNGSGIYGMTNTTITANGNTINNPGTFGILAEYNAKALVLSNTVNNSKDKAIFLNACASGSTVNNNTVNNPKQYGIFIYDAQGEIANNVISGNKVNNAVNWAIYVSKHSKASCNATIKNNTVTAPKHYGIFANNATVKISGNKVSDGKNDGIWLSACTNSSVSGNTVERDAKRGIGAYNSNNITISNNTVKDAVGHGIYFGSASGKTVKATVSGNVSVSKYTSNKDIIVWDHAKYCVVKNNTYGKRGLSVQKGSCSTNSGNAVAAYKVTLSTTNYNYDGNVKTPAVTVKYGARVLTKDTHYTVKYAAGRKDVGRYSVTVTFKGGYSGTKTATFKINPKGTSLGTLTPASKKFTAHWTAQKTKMSASEITGYEIQYSTSKNFKSGVKTARVKGVNSHAAVIAKLGAKRNYYVRIRTYETVNHVDCFSTWSKVKTVKTK